MSAKKLVISFWVAILSLSAIAQPIAHGHAHNDYLARETFI
jgi:hypothetical protein